MSRKKPTVADLRARKGKGQLTMLRVMTLDEAAAAEAAGIDIVSVPPDLVAHPRYREVAPSLFSMTGQTHLEAGSRDDYLRWACKVMLAGADAVYCSGGLGTVDHVAREHIPVVGHVGLVPSRATWTGGFKAVGKTLDSAKRVWDQCVALEDAGAFAVEIEVVPHQITAAIAERTGLFLVAMGGGPAAHAQYLFSDDVLGQNNGHIPRHAKIYADFTAEYAKLQEKRVAAMKGFADDVHSGAYPSAPYLVASESDVVAAFREWLGRQV